MNSRDRLLGSRRLIRSLGKRPLGWQEFAPAGLGSDDIIQYRRKQALQAFTIYFD